MNRDRPPASGEWCSSRAAALRIGTATSPLLGGFVLGTVNAKGGRAERLVEQVAVVGCR